MIIATDAKIVDTLSTVFGLSASRMMYGTLEEASIWWIRNNPDDPGVESLPYLAFNRSVDFGERRDVQSKRVLTSVPPDYSGAVDIDWTPVVLIYNVDLITATRLEQIDAMRSYMFWANRTPYLTFTDDTPGGTGYTHEFGVIADPPEDNSALEEAEETGRVVRTTVSFRVDSYLMDISSPLAGGAIQEILGQVNLYNGGDLLTPNVEADNPDGSTPLINETG